MKFTDSHEWINEEGLVGITAYAQKELGDIVFVQLPQVGTQLTVGQEAVVLESTKAAADVYTPVSGTVIAINEALQDSPSLLTSDPEKTGWLFKVQIETPTELDRLLNREQYDKLLKGSS